jgi:hypothetical protein
MMAVAFFFGGIAFSSLGSSSWKSYIPTVLFFFLSLITCQGFFYNCYDQLSFQQKQAKHICSKVWQFLLLPRLLKPRRAMLMWYEVHMKKSLKQYDAICPHLHVYHCPHQAIVNGKV